MDEFQRIYKENYKKIYYYLKNICRNDRLAEDLTQETFYKVLLYIYNGKALNVCTSWLIKIAHNIFIDFIRKSKVDTDSLTLYENELGTPTTDSPSK